MHLGGEAQSVGGGEVCGMWRREMKNTLFSIIVLSSLVCLSARTSHVLGKASANLYAVDLMRAITLSVPIPANPLSAWSEDPHIVRMVGRFWLIRGNAAQTVATLESVAPNYHDPLFTSDLILAYVANGQTEQAIATLKKQRISTDELVIRAQRLRDAGQTAAGDIYAQAAVEQGGGNVGSRLYLGLWLMWNHRPEQGNAYFDSVMRDNHTEPWIWGELAWAYYNLAGRYDEALQAIQRALELYPDNDLYWFRAGRIYLARGLARGEPADKKIGREILEDLAARNPLFGPSAWDALGWCYLMEGNVTLAVPLLEQACAQEPANGYFKINLAQALVVRGYPGDRQRAIDLLQELIQRYPDWPPATGLLQTITESP